MMRNEVPYQKIRAYLLGELTPDQVKDIEALIALDPEFAAEVEACRSLLPALDRLNERGLQANFQKWKAELGDEKKTVRNTRHRWLYIVVCLGIALLGLLYLVSREPAGALENNMEIPTDTPQQTPSAKSNDSIRQSKPPPVTETPTKKQTTSQDKTHITARQLALRQISDMIPPVVTEVRGSKKESQWTITIQQVDTLAANQHYTEALNLLNNSSDLPKGHSLIRQVYLQHNLNMHQAAIKTYRKYEETVGNPDEAEWGLALVYLAAYSTHKADFWKQIDAIEAMSGHAYQAETEKLVEKLKNAGILR
ncbi:MAG: hypothetical protein R3D58_14915 [Saprospiraceae bacterium]